MSSMVPSAAAAPPVEQHEQRLEHPRGPACARVAERIDRRREARDQDRLRLGVLADAADTVATADAGILPAGERRSQLEVVGQRVVDAGAAGFDLARDLLALGQVAR